MQVRIENLSITYGETDVIRGLWLDIPPGVSLAVVGQSGQGKTTLLRAIAGLIQPTGGGVSLDGTSPNSQYGSGQLSFLFQEACLCPQLSLRDNLRLAYWALRKTPDEREIDLQLSAVALSDAQSKFPHEASAGMKARTAIARMLCIPPKLLLMDEPFAALDPLRRLELNLTVKNVCRRIGATSIWASHDVVEAVTFADRILALAPDKSARIFETARIPPIEDSAALPPEAIRLRDEIIAHIWGGSPHA